MNILLNNYCNLSCEYCFANKVLKEDRQIMSMEDFKFVLDFLRRSNDGNVRLIGGEPTLHPKFHDIFLEAVMSPWVNSVLVFTNGTYDDKIGDLLYLGALHKPVSVLINYNSPESVGKFNWGRINQNLKNAHRGGKVKVTLGINFFKPDQNYGYFLDACKEYDVKVARWSLTVPNSEEKKNNIVGYFKEHTPLIMNFISDCVRNGIQPRVDCNNIPLCLLSDDDLRNLAMIDERSLRKSMCSPVLDVKPNLEVIRCFALSDHVVHLKDFENERELSRYFSTKVDPLYDKGVLFDQCNGCPSHEMFGKACACLTYLRPEGGHKIG